MAKIDLLLSRAPVFDIKSKRHPNSNQIDFQCSVHWLLYKQSQFKKKITKVSQLYARLSIFQLFC